MTITLATGIDSLDIQLKSRLEEELGISSIIINYRDILLKECTDTVIITENLLGSVEFTNLIFKLKSNGVRVILLLDSMRNPLFYKALKFAIYDILFDESATTGITIEDIIDIVKNPKTIKDFAKIVAAIGDVKEDIDPSVTEDNDGQNDSSAHTEDDQKLTAGKQKIIIKEVEKIKEVHKYVTVNFTNKIYCVWGNPQFASELSYYIAKKTIYNVLLLDLDMTALKTDLYLGLEDHMITDPESKFKKVADALKFGLISKEVFINQSYKPIDKLYVLLPQYSANNYSLYKELSVKDLMDHAYRNFDITIVSLCPSIHDHYTIEAIKYSQTNILPIKADMPTISEYVRYIKLLDGRPGCELDKHKIVAYQYKKGIDTSVSDLKRVFENSYLGQVSYNIDREKCAAVGEMYVDKMTVENQSEYEQILTTLGIAVKQTLLQKIKSKFIKNN